MKRTPVNSNRPVRARQVETSLVDVLDRLIDKGVVLTGDLTISVADVDLISLQLNLLLSSIDRLQAGDRVLGGAETDRAPQLRSRRR